MDSTNVHNSAKKNTQKQGDNKSLETVVGGPIVLDLKEKEFKMPPRTFGKGVGSFEVILSEMLQYHMEIPAEESMLNIKNGEIVSENGSVAILDAKAVNEIIAHEKNRTKVNKVVDQLKQNNNNVYEGR